MFKLPSVLKAKKFLSDLGLKNNDLTCVVAAFEDTDMTKKYWLNTKTKRKITAAEHPLGRIGTGNDIAKAVLYFASDDSSWTTGAVLPVDGGVSVK